MTKFNKKIQSGFTLIELMVAISIAAVLMMVAAPNFTEFKRNAELTTTSNTLLSSLNAARGEAMKRGMRAMATPIDGEDWSKGLVVFVDVDGSQEFEASNDITVLTRDELPSHISISNSGTSSEDPPYMMFDPSGYAVTKSGGFGANTFLVKRNDVSESNDLKQTRMVKIAATGRVRVCTPAAENDALCDAEAAL